MRKNIDDSFYKLEKDDKKWMDREGNIHNIKDMDLFHVYYTVKMIERKNKTLEIMNKSTFIIPDLLLKRLEEFYNIYPEYAI